MSALLLQMGLPQASTVAPLVDHLFDFIYYICLFCFLATIGALTYFCVRYHRSRNHPENTPYIEGHPLMEGAVMVGLFFIVMIFFYWGWVDYKEIRKTPANALEINVTGRQWAWDFEYTNGRKMNKELVVPKGRAVKLILASNDVLHSFFIPDFRVKQDVVPGSYQFLWFNATETGDHQVFCAEYCGTSHSGMLATVKVVEPEEYEKWQKTWEWEKQLGVSPSEATENPAQPSGASPTKPTSAATNAPSSAPANPAGAPANAPGSTPGPANISLVERGQKVFNEKGCNVCHSVNGSPLVGPTLKGLFGHEVELEGDKKVTADENYIRESIMDSNAKIVKGFQPLMPVFKGSLSDDEINSLVAYIKSLQ
jgi:cytochrome c oxidase subunit 2